MPPLETADRNQKALYREFRGVDRYGNPTVLSPIELDVRWNHTRTKGTDPLGNTIALDATVVVDRTLEIGSILWEGTLADFVGTGSGSGGEDTELMEVKTMDVVKDLKGRNTRRVAGLVRYRDQLPALA